MLPAQELQKLILELKDLELKDKNIPVLVKG